jgi:hypothetical protein
MGSSRVYYFPTARHRGDMARLDFKTSDVKRLLSIFAEVEVCEALQVALFKYHPTCSTMIEVGVHKWSAACSFLRGLFIERIQPYDRGHGALHRIAH